MLWFKNFAAIWPLYSIISFLKGSWADSEIRLGILRKAKGLAVNAPAQMAEKAKLWHLHFYFAHTDISYEL